MGNYPEHDKLQERAEEHRAIAEFLEWLEEHPKYHLAEYFPDPRAGKFRDRSEWRSGIGDLNTARLLGEYFDVDYNELQAEKDRMLAEIRNQLPKGIGEANERVRQAARRGVEEAWRREGYSGEVAE